MKTVVSEMAPHPYTQFSSKEGDTIAWDTQENKEDQADCLNNNQIRNRSKGINPAKNILPNIYNKYLQDADFVSPLPNTMLSSSLPEECRLLLLSHQFLLFRSQRRVVEAGKYFHPSCNSSTLLPHYNTHLMVKNISSIKAFLSPSPPHVLCEFSSGEFSYSERIYFQVRKSGVYCW